MATSQSHIDLSKASDEQLEAEVLRRKRQREEQHARNQPANQTDQLLKRRKLAETKSSRKREQRQLPPAIYEAQIDKLADSESPMADSNNGGGGVETMAKIRKILFEARHGSAADLEVKAALLLATRLMARENITEAEKEAMLNSGGADEDAGGFSNIFIRRKDGNRTMLVKLFDYVKGLALAMSIYFDCSFYTTRRPPAAVEVTFYGIPKNTTAAALGFEVVYNQMSDWARPLLKDDSRKSYFRGIADEQKRLARAEKSAEEAQAKRADQDASEARYRQDEMERQAPFDCSKPESDESSGIGHNATISEDPINDEVSDDDGPDDHVIEADFVISEEEEAEGNGLTKLREEPADTSPALGCSLTVQRGNQQSSQVLYLNIKLFKCHKIQQPFRAMLMLVPLLTSRHQCCRAVRTRQQVP